MRQQPRSSATIITGTPLRTKRGYLQCGWRNVARSAAIASAVTSRNWRPEQMMWGRIGFWEYGASPPDSKAFALRPFDIILFVPISSLW